MADVLEPEARQTDAADSLASPRLFRRHQRYARYTRLNHSKQEIEFLAVEAARLSTTEALIFGALDSYTADQIRAASAKSDIGL
jgi:hypothetical protein